jgi:cold shock CspA family protein
MARSQASATKKEREKQKLQKKKEKEQRKEDRKANSRDGNNLDDMMAYVDENGNITSVPPDPTKKRAAVNVDDILIGARKIEEGSPDNVHTGIVTYFNSSKGYGFIKDDRSKESIFVHTSSLSSPIKENDRVSFHTERGHRGTVAVQVKKA